MIRAAIALYLLVAVFGTLTLGHDAEHADAEWFRSQKSPRTASFEAPRENVEAARTTF